jgi:N-acetylmuramoyl-L-alanine amidase
MPSIPRLLVIVSCLAAVGAMIYGPRSTIPRPEGVAEVTPAPGQTILPVAADPQEEPAMVEEEVLAATPLPALVSTPASPEPRIGIVAGHWQNDTGAVCPDGLKEVDINLDVAQRVVAILESLGHKTDLMAEFDPRLQGYWAYLIVSIHADSCENFPNASPPASGFKVARVEDSMVPDEEDRLVNCLAQQYAGRTGMYFHANSVTHDMTRYHTFYEIDGRTPAAIIETGFMRNDRQMLTQNADLVAQGIVDGIVCFLEGDGSP